MSRDESLTIDGRMLLNIFPPFVQSELLQERVFRERIGIKLDGIINLNQDKVKVRRDDFFSAIRSIYSGSTNLVEIDDEAGKTWTLTLGKDADRSVIAVASGEQRFLVEGLSTLSPDESLRISDFKAALYDAGLPPTGFPQWRALLENGPLENADVLLLNTDLSRTPVSLSRILAQQLHDGTCDVETMAPPYREYFEHLCGSGGAETVEDLANDIVPSLVSDLLAWDRREGARMALLLASHSLIIPNSGLNILSPDEIADLANWAAESGDLISKVGMIELGMASLPSTQSLCAIIQTLIEQILELDPTDAESRIHMLSGMLIFTYSELSRSKVLDDLPPFRRRFAALTQASYFERNAFAHLEPSGFKSWALESGSNRFYLQVLVEMRLEPRWVPEYAGAFQLKHELIGRIINASNTNIDKIPEGTLRTFLFGDEPTEFTKQILVLKNRLPGPLEGAEVRSRAEMPADFVQMLDDNLKSEKLDAKSVVALINMRGLFNIGGDKIDRLVELIRQAQHRFSDEIDVETRDILISGLAEVASTTRNTALADDIRVMFRKNRVDDVSPLSPQIEFLTALMAAAAHHDIDDWMLFIGDWAMELAVTVKIKDDAEILKYQFETLCIIEPALRKHIGRAIAATEAFLKS